MSITSVNITNQYIDIFPISRPRSNPGARVLSEQNLRNFIKGCTDSPSYVISNNYEKDNSFEFVIDGYYCKIISESNNYPIPLTINTDCDIFAVINFTPADSSTNNYPYQILDIKEDEENNILCGIDFKIVPRTEFLSKDTIQTTFRILSVQYNEGNPIYTIPSESKVKFEGSSLNLNEVDGGEI